MAFKKNPFCYRLSQNENENYQQEQKQEDLQNQSNENANSINEDKDNNQLKQKNSQLNVNGSLDKEERNPACEEVIIIEERGGAQEHHNQTMDELYHQNTNNEDCPIKCNVVSNQLNFVNSINYRNKNDFNTSLAHIEVQPKDLQQQSQKDSSSSSLSANQQLNDKDEEKEDIRNILQDLFPNYQQHYWNDRSTWNPIHKHNRTLNDSFELSFHSFELQQNYVHNTTNSDIQKSNNQQYHPIQQQSPLLIEDVSVIMDANQKEKIHSSEEPKHQSALHLDTEHDMHHDMFFEGLTSLFLDRRSSINNNLNLYIHPGNTLSHSSDSHQKTLKNSLKYKVMVHSSNEMETICQIGQNSKIQLEKDDNKSSRFEIRIVENITPTQVAEQPKIQIDPSPQDNDNSSTPNFQTPKLTPVISKHESMPRASEELYFNQLFNHRINQNQPDVKIPLNQDDNAYSSDQLSSNYSKRFKITHIASQPLSVHNHFNQQSLRHHASTNFKSAMNSENDTPLANQKSPILKHSASINFINAMVVWNNQMSQNNNQNDPNYQTESLTLQGEDSPDRQQERHSSNEYFQFEGASTGNGLGNGDYSNRSSIQKLEMSNIFDQPLLS